MSYLVRFKLVRLSAIFFASRRNRALPITGCISASLGAGLSLISQIELDEVLFTNELGKSRNG